MEMRVERDDRGEVMIPARRYWGAKTERRRSRAGVGLEPVPGEMLRAFGILKKAAARVNFTFLPQQIDEKKCAAIFAAADELIRGKLTEDFPLPVWQPGAGGQTDDNINEVIARRGNEMADEELLTPEDVALSISPESAFPTALRIAAALAVSDTLLPVAETLSETAQRFDAERASELRRCCGTLRARLDGLLALAPGALPDAPEGFDAAVAAEAGRMTDKPFKAAPGRPEDLDDLARAHGAMRELADAMDKLAAVLPERIPPTFSRADADELREQTALAAAHVLGGDAAIGFAAVRPMSERRVFLPLCAYDFLQSARLLSSTASALVACCAGGAPQN